MRLINKLKKFFYIGEISEQKFAAAAAAAAAARLIEYTASLVLRTDLIKPHLARIEAGRVLSPAEKAKEYIKVYFELEKFILDHEPLVVKRRFTQEELRKDIREKLGALGAGYDLLLTGDIEQAVKLCKVMSESILNQTTTMLGQATSQRFMEKAGVFEFRAAEFRNPEQVISSFQKLSSDLYSAISNTIGKEKAKSIFEVNYKKLEEVYEFIPYTIEILQVLPLGILEEEKIKILSKSELEERIIERTRALEESKAYVDNIIKSMVDTLIVVNPEGNIQTVNPATVELLGYKEDELIGHPVATIFAEEEEEEEETPFKGTKMQKLIEEGSIRDYDMTYKTKSDERIPVSFSGSVMRDKDGNLIGIVGIARDMREIRRLMEKEKELAAAAAETDRKRAAELEKTQDASLNIMERSERRRKELDNAYKELRETQAKLIEKEKMAALGELGAGAAHELNNPLAGIMGFTELVLNDVKSNSINREELIENLETVMQDTYRCKNIVANLLNYARGKEPEKAENDISRIIEESLDIVERQGILKDIKVIKGYGMDLPKVYVDKGQMTQVFVNILVNAHKAMPNGGEIFIKSWLDKNYVVIEFKDTGRGIEKENLGKVFDPFFTTYRPGGGTGLGLSVCYSIIKAHRGEIETRSEGVDKGASFVVRIPV